MFAQFGTVVDIEQFDEDRHAYVRFEDVLQAFAAQSYLNGFYMTSHNVILTVRWLRKEDQEEGSYRPSNRYDAQFQSQNYTANSQMDYQMTSNNITSQFPNSSFDMHAIY